MFAALSKSAVTDCHQLGGGRSARGGRAQRRPSNDPYELAFMLMAKLLMVNFSGLLFVDTSSTPWQIW